MKGQFYYPHEEKTASSFFNICKKVLTACHEILKTNHLIPVFVRQIKPCGISVCLCIVFLYKLMMLSLYSSHLLSRTILLASNSPQRQKILKEIGLSFKVVPSNFAEDLDQKSFSSPAEFVKETAKQKALDVANRIDAGIKLVPHLIIAADTVVVLDNEIIGKPKSEKDNVDILKRLSGRSHSVFTGIALIVYEWNGSVPFKHIKTLHDVTDVCMAPLPTEVIEAYVKTGEPANKAGGYGIQGLASTFIEEIKGDYFNVVGLPAYKLAKEIYDLCKSSLL